VDLYHERLTVMNTILALDLGKFKNVACFSPARPAAAAGTGRFGGSADPERLRRALVVAYRAEPRLASRRPRRPALATATATVPRSARPPASHQRQ